MLVISHSMGTVFLFIWGSRMHRHRCGPLSSPSAKALGCLFKIFNCVTEGGTMRIARSGDGKDLELLTRLSAVMISLKAQKVT